MTSMTDTPGGLPAPLAQAIAFIWMEGELLDNKDYAAWSALWDATGKYVIPIDPAATDFDSTLNYVNDDARMRALRIARLSSGFSMSAADASATVRTISRFRLVSCIDNVAEVNSAQVVVGYKRGKHTLFAASLTHRIDLSAATPLLLQKVVRLINAEDSLSALGFLL